MFDREDNGFVDGVFINRSAAAATTEDATPPVTLVADAVTEDKDY
jgi:hypothetical protein